MKKIFVFTLLSCLLFSCSYEKKLGRAKKKLANLISEYPALVQHDTLWHNDTTIVSGIAHDTLFKTTITKDTMIIKDHQLTIKYYNDGKTTYLQGKCDTVFVVKKVPEYINNVNPAKEIERSRQWYDWMAYIISILALIFIILDVYTTFRKKPNS